MRTPIDWEARYQAGDCPWDKGEASPPLRTFLQNHRLQGRVLVPGCGTGHDARLLAEHGLSVTGLDISESAISLAGRATPPALAITWRHGDIFQLPADWTDSFDGLFEHTCFCAIQPEMRIHYVEAISKVVKRGGYFLAIFYMNPEAEEGPPYGCTRKELDEFFNPAWRLVEELIPTVGYEGRVGRELLRFYQRWE